MRSTRKTATEDGLNVGIIHSADGGNTWKPILRDLPSVLSVEVQTLP